MDEVMLGWRGEMVGPAGFLGLAAGRFQPDLIQKFFQQTNLPVREYNGADLYAFGSGTDANDLFFTFFDNTLAAFGRLGDVKAMVDARMGSINALNTNSDFVNWQGELDGTAPAMGHPERQVRQQSGGIVAGSRRPEECGFELAGALRARPALPRSVGHRLYRRNSSWCATRRKAPRDLPPSSAFCNKPPSNPPRPAAWPCPPSFRALKPTATAPGWNWTSPGPPELLDQILPQGGS